MGPGVSAEPGTTVCVGRAGSTAMVYISPTPLCSCFHIVRRVKTKLFSLGWSSDDVEASGALSDFNALSCTFIEEGTKVSISHKPVIRSFTANSEWPLIFSKWERRLKKALNDNLPYRHSKQVAAKYKSLKEDLSGRGYTFVPGWQDVRQMPEMFKLLRRFIEPFNDNIWGKWLPNIVSDVETFNQGCQDDVIKLLQVDGKPVFQDALCNEILYRASSLVLLNGRLTFASKIITQYTHSGDLVNWQTVLDQYSPVPQGNECTVALHARRIATGLLKLLGFAENVSSSEVEVLGDTFACLAQCPISGLMSFEALVSLLSDCVSLLSSSPANIVLGTTLHFRG